MRRTGLRRAGTCAALSALLAAASGPPAPAAPARPNTLPGAPSAACPAPGPGLRISAFFTFAQPGEDANAVYLDAMCADAITFGERLVPGVRMDVPAALQGFLPPDAEVYRYLGGVALDRSALGPTDRQVTVGGTTWTLVVTGPRSVVVSSDGQGDSTGALTRAGDRLGRRTILGLPRPQQDPATPYLPDLTYRDALLAFTERFVKDAVRDGADGFYQTVEMPAGGSRTTWGGVLDLYAAQHALVGRARPGALLLVSPYLESRVTHPFVTPAQAADGVRALLATAGGTRMVVAPQDGLGAGTTSLREDRERGRVAGTEDYFAAMRGAAGDRLWVNVELMRPQGTGRRPTTRQRVDQQLRAEAPFVSGAVAFLWDDPGRGIGAVRVPGGLGAAAPGRLDAYCVWRGSLAARLP